MTIDLTTLHLERGGHSSRESGVSVMEAVAWLAHEPHTNRPECASPVIAAFCRAVNDRVGDEERQRLVAYLPRLVETRAADEVELRRTMILADWAVRVAAPVSLEIAGLSGEAEGLRRLPPVTEGDSAREAGSAARATEEAATRGAAEAASAARTAARGAWMARAVGTAREAEQASAADQARGVAEIEEAARTAAAEASAATHAAWAAWIAATHAEAVAHAEVAAQSAVAAWAAAAHAAVQVPTAPIDWTVPLERVLDVS